MDPPGYTIAQASRIVGATRRQLEYWAETDLVAPALTRPGGRRRLYTFFDLVELRTLLRLRSEGQVPLQRLRKVIAELEGVRDRPLRTCTLISAHQRVFLVEDNDTVIEVLREEQLVMALSIEGLEFEVRREIKRRGLPAPPPLEAAAAA
jgi:DNA-binding transcriptional MerR regulator